MAMNDTLVKKQRYTKYHQPHVNVSINPAHTGHIGNNISQPMRSVNAAVVVWPTVHQPGCL